MKKRSIPIIFLIIFILSVIIIVIEKNAVNFYITKIAESTKKSIVSDIRSPRNIIDFYVWTSQKFKNQGSTILKEGKEPIAGSCKALTCKLFSISFDVKGNPQNWGTEEWLDFYKKHKAEIDKLYLDAETFQYQVSCPGECPIKKKDKYYSVSVTPINAAPGPCNMPPIPFTLSATGSSCVGDTNENCPLATSDAANKLKKQLDDLIKNKCGSACSSAVVITSYELSDCHNDPSFFCPYKKSVDLSIKGILTCSGQPQGDMYRITISINACVSCSKKEPVIAPAQPLPNLTIEDQIKPIYEVKDRAQAN